MPNPAETANQEPSGYDHAPRFRAFEQNFSELSHTFEYLFAHSEFQPIEVDDPEDKLLLTSEEIGKLWGLFPANARSRAIPHLPLIKTGKPLWFSKESSPGDPQITDIPQNAISPTAHAMAKTSIKFDAHGHVIGTNGITVHEIPENGFDTKVKRLIQAGVLVHEFAHTIVNVELWNPDPDYSLVFPGGNNAINMRDWFVAFLLATEEYSPITRYSATYRNQDNTYPRQGESVILGTAVNEELADSISAQLLGFAVQPKGLTFEPFQDRPEIQHAIQMYLSARPSTL